MLKSSGRDKRKERVAYVELGDPSQIPRDPLELLVNEKLGIPGQIPRDPSQIPSKSQGI